MRTARSRWSDFGRWMQVQRVTREGLAGIRRDRGAAVAEAEGLTAHRRAVEIRFEDERDRRADASRPPLPDARLAGLHLGAVQPGHRGALRPSTRATSCASTPTPPRPRRTSWPTSLGGPVRPAPQRVPGQRLRGPDRGRGRVRRGASRTRSSSGRARTRSWTSSPRRTCRPGGSAIVPIPTYAMYGVLTSQRGARDRGHPAAGPPTASRLDLRRPCCRAWPRSAWSGCARRTTRPARPEPLEAIERRARRRRSSSVPTARWSWSTRPTTSSGPTSVVGLRQRYPEPGRGAHGVQGVRAAGHARGVRRRGPADHRAPGAPAAAGQHLDRLGRRGGGGPAPSRGRPRQRRAPGRRARLARRPPRGAGPGRHIRASPTSCWCGSGTRGRGRGRPPTACCMAGIVSAHLRAGEPAPRPPAPHGAQPGGERAAARGAAQVAGAEAG